MTVRHTDEEVITIVRNTSILSRFFFRPGFQLEKGDSGYYVATKPGGKFVFQRSGASYFRIFLKNLAKKNSISKYLPPIYVSETLSK